MRDDDVQTVASLLSKKIPMELVFDIMNRAQYLPHMVIAQREETIVAGSFESQIYLTGTIPQTEYKKGIRKIIFRLKSRDQGGSHYPESHGTYKAAWSWLQAELWRNKAEETGATTNDPEQKIYDSKPIDLVYEDFSDESDDPDNFYCWHYYHGFSQRREEDGDMYKIGTWILQRNKHAGREFVNHEIVWDSAVDELSPLRAPLPELDPTYRDEAKWRGIVRFYETGHVANGRFVRELRPGDEIRVVMRAMFPLWSCIAEWCEIECWWNL